MLGPVTPEDEPNWLGDLQWQGYPRLAPIRDAASLAGAGGPPRRRTGGEVRLEALAKENEALRAKIETLTRLTSEFEQRLSEAAQSYEGAALESDSTRRSVELDNARLSGELESARAEIARGAARDQTRDADLSLERSRRADCEKALLEARRSLNELASELAASRGRGAELAGSIGELRRQATASHERLVQAKALTDQDVQILRAEMREFIAKFHRIQETFTQPPGDAP